MQLTIEILPRDEQLAMNRQRWVSILADRSLANLAYRVETNAYGQLLMSPLASGGHSNRQGEIAFQLRRLLGGKALPECPILTVDGAKVADVGWYTDARFAKVENQNVFENAPEICVEVLSPSNSELEMKSKRHLYFDAGAEEVWISDLAGKIVHYLKSSPDDPNPNATSTLCPNFPHA